MFPYSLNGLFSIFLCISLSLHIHVLHDVMCIIIIISTCAHECIIKSLNNSCPCIVYQCHEPHGSILNESLPQQDPLLKVEQLQFLPRPHQVTSSSSSSNNSSGASNKSSHDCVDGTIRIVRNAQIILLELNFHRKGRFLIT